MADASDILRDVKKDIDDVKKSISSININVTEIATSSRLRLDEASRDREILFKEVSTLRGDHKIMVEDQRNTAIKAAGALWGFIVVLIGIIANIFKH